MPNSPVQSATALPEIALSPLVRGNEAQIIHALLSSTNHGILMTDLQGTDILCNTRFGELFGIDPEVVVHSTRDEVRNMALARVKDPEAFNLVMDRVYADPASAHEDEVELSTVPPRILRRYTGPVFDAAGNNLGRVWTFDDVTEMRRLQAEVQAFAAELAEQYRRQAEDLRHTTEILNVMTAVFAALAESPTTDSMLSMVVRSARRLPGWDAAALLLHTGGGRLAGYACRNEGPPQPLNLDLEEDDSLDRALHRSSGGRRLQLLDDKPKSLAEALGGSSLGIAPMFREERMTGLLALGCSDGQVERGLDRGEHLGAVVDQIALAIEARQLHGELQQAYDDLRAAHEGLVESAKLGAVGTLAVSIAHDIRNILTPLTLELAMAGPDSPLATARAHVDRLSALAHRLLALAQPARIEQGAVDIPAMLEGVREILLHQAEVDGLAFCGSWPDNLPAVRGDRSRLEHLFINLVLNGLNAMAGRGGTLRMAASHSGDFVRIDIADEGAGIAAENLNKIFDPFFTTRKNGSGLGLFSVKRITDEHGGRISVESRQGAGACFSVWLPAYSELEGQ